MVGNLNLGAKRKSSKIAVESVPKQKSTQRTVYVTSSDGRIERKLRISLLGGRYSSCEFKSVGDTASAAPTQWTSDHSPFISFPHTPYCHVVNYGNIWN